MSSGVFKGQISHFVSPFPAMVLALCVGSQLPSGGRAQEFTALPKVLWCTEWCYFSLGSKKQARKVRTGNTRKRENRDMCLFLRLQLLLAQLLWRGKLRLLLAGHLVPGGEECGVWVSCRAHPAPCHPLPSHLCCLALPVPARGAELVAELLLSWLCCWHPSTSTEFLCHCSGSILWGRGKKKSPFFKVEKIRVNFFSFTWHNPTKWMLHCHCQLLFSYGCSIRDTSKMRIFFFFKDDLNSVSLLPRVSLNFCAFFFYLLKLAQTLIDLNPVCFI